MGARVHAREAVAAFVLAGALAGAGCSWRTFDDLKKQTPVLAIGAPSDYPAGDDFGPILLPLAPPADKSAAGRFIATATYKTSVAVMSFDAKGNIGGSGVTGTAFDKLAGGPVNQIAMVPGGAQVLLGAPATMFGDVLVMNVDPPFMTSTFSEVSEPQYGAGVAAGNIGGAAAPEVVVLSTDTLHVHADVVLPGIGTEFTRASMGAADPCPIELTTALLPRDRANRAVLIASLLGAGTQIAVGTPTASGPGHVSIFDFDGTSITCSAALTASEPRFGRSMTLVDVDGDGTKDHLLVGAPPTHAYLYKLPLTGGQAPVGMATESSPDSDFGAAVAAFDIDGKPGDEMFVGDPDAAVGGETTAGRVSIYTGEAMTKVLASVVPNPLALHEPKSGDGYGSGIAGMTFCPGNVAATAGDGGAADAGSAASDGGVAPCTTLPLVGTLSKTYAYFTLKKPDPRGK
jgi:hypothetical protein